MEGVKVYYRNIVMLVKYVEICYLSVLSDISIITIDKYDVTMLWLRFG